MQLAVEHPVDADLVMPVPDTGAPAAAGYAEASGMPYREGMVPQPVRRPDLHPAVAGAAPAGRDDQAQPAARGRPRQAADRRRRLDRARHDDQADRRACCARPGATEVHVRISAPPIYHPCFYGIDTSIETELIASTHTERRDPRVHRRRFARLPVDPRRARGARAAVRAVLLRLLRRQLPGARPVRRGEPQVHARGGRCVGAMTRPGRRHAGAPTRGRRRRRGRRARGRADARARRVDAPARGRRRPRRVRRRVRDPGRLPRAAARRLDRRRRHEDRDRRGARAVRHDRHRPRRDVRRRRRLHAAPSRSPSSTTSRSAGSTRWRSPSSSAASPPAVARPAARWSAARPPSTRA